MYGLVQAFGGTVAVASEVGRGTTFRITLRDETEAPRAGEAAAPPAAAAESGATIIVAEDDAAVRSLVTQALLLDGFRVLAAQDGEQALALARREGACVTLLLTDVLMPGMSGRELAREVRRLLPGVAVLFISGGSESAPPSDLETIEGAAFLQKPFTPSTLLSQVRRILAGRSGA